MLGARSMTWNDWDGLEAKPTWTPTMMEPVGPCREDISKVVISVIKEVILNRL